VERSQSPAIALGPAKCKRGLTASGATFPQAISLGQPTEVAEGVVVSTIVEDVLFILRKSLERAMSTLSDQATMAVGNRVRQALE
jgi:hypothetical protein